LPCRVDEIDIGEELGADAAKPHREPMKRLGCEGVTPEAGTDGVT
jgi:hypothetical protein